MKMQNSNMEFVTFDAQDVIATSGGANLTYLYASKSVDTIKPAGFAFDGIDLSATDLPNPTNVEMKWTPNATINAITGFKTTNFGFGLEYTTFAPDSNAEGIDVTDPDNGFMTNGNVNLKLIYEWLQGATNGHKAQ